MDGISPLEFAPYRLLAEQSLNARAKRTIYPGALVRQGGGYACLHPWPELGDAPLEEQLQTLASKGDDTPLTRSTRECLALDAEARRSGTWLFQNRAAIPESHATLPAPTRESLREAARQGFRAAKIKGGPDRLAALAALLENSPLPLRIDFNETMTRDALCRWHDSLGEAARRRLQWVEDPCPYDPETWDALHQHTGWELALDRQAAHPQGGFQILVFKPAVMKLDNLGTWPDQRDACVVVSSYMDHPLGQLYAAFQATRLAGRFPELRLLGGLATHGLFTGLPPALDLGQGPRIAPPPGTGLGLDDYLESLPWKPWIR